MADEPKPTKPVRKRKPAAAIPTETKFTPELAERMVGLVRRGNFREMACAQVGVSSRTLRNWLSAAAAGDARYIDFALKLEQAEAEAEDLLVVSVRRAAMKDWKAAAWLLERRGAKRWGFKAQVEVSVEEELARIIDVIELELGGEAAARVFARLSHGATSPTEARGAGPPEGSPGEGDPIH
jgi:hypothetical protein